MGRGAVAGAEAVEKLSRFVHGPYAAKECERCHDLESAASFREFGSGRVAGRSSKVDIAEAGRLRMPIDELCVHCHTDLGTADAANDGLWVHGPVANGWCVTCHQSHSSRYPSLLHSEPPARLCGQCHVREDLVAQTAEHRPIDPQQGFPPPSARASLDREGETEEASPEHRVVQVVKDCTRCHDPHRGPDRFILKDRRDWGPDPGGETGPRESDPEPGSPPQSGSRLSRAAPTP
ncbi:MAG: cytochrome c3 family protein [Myxococcota bacterium]